MKLLTAFFIVALNLSYTGVAAAQGSPSSKAPGQSCDRFKHRIVPPPPGVDFKLIVTAPSKVIDYKLRIINPCKGTARVVTVKPGFSPQKKGTGFFEPQPFSFAAEPVKDEAAPPTQPASPPSSL